MANANSISVQRFLFETSFDPEEIERRAREARQASDAARAAQEHVPEPEPEPPPPTFSEEELEETREAAYAAGLEAGRREAMQSVERDTATALQSAMERVGGLIEAQRASDAELAGHAIDATLTLVRKMLPALMFREGPAEIEALVRDCLADVLEEPRIVIRVNDALLDTMRPRVDEIARSLGYQGAVVLLSDTALGPGDVKVEWADGGAERLSDRLWANIEAAADRLKDFGAAAAPTASPSKRRRKTAAASDAAPTNAS